jgi:energy-coupling factor transporter ATP-binding protein EcfA2
VQESKIEAQYKLCLSKLDSRNISKRGREIISGESTPELQKALIHELKAINVTSVEVAFKAHGAAGKTLYDIELTGASSKTPLSKVLSEGEQKAIAIASFMAELKFSENSYPIVFDDPVTSLDHIFRDKIAERIALESCARQVIVFTHDISFVVELEKHVAKQNSERAIITLRHDSANPGNVVSDKPWNLMKVSDRLIYLDSKIAYLKTLSESDQARYDEKAAGWYSLFRETWEAIVEETILNNSIRRFGAEIKTMSIREVEISDEDYKVLDLFMSKASEWMLGHDKSKELSVHRPPTSELANDIVETRAFVKAVNKNRNTVSARRKKLLEPVQAEIG